MRRYLNEDKSRFIKKIRDFFQYFYDKEHIHFEYNLADEVSEKIGHEIRPENLPSWENIEKFANTAKNINVDWNTIYSTDMLSLDPHRDWPQKYIDCFEQIVNLFVAYYTNQDKQMSKGRTNPKALFSDESMFKVVYENEDWIFVGVLTYEAAKVCDSYKVGGFGAKWCIGWQQSNDYWYKYTGDNNHFVLAFSKANWGTDYVKYMLQIHRKYSGEFEVTGWRQDDNPEMTLNKEECMDAFGIPQSMDGLPTFEVWWNKAEPKRDIVNTFDLNDIMGDARPISLETDKTSLRLKASTICGGKLNLHDISRLVSPSGKANMIQELVYDGSDLPSDGDKVVILDVLRFMPTCKEQEKETAASHFKPNKLVFCNLDSIAIGECWIDFRWMELEFRNCKHISIKRVITSRIPDNSIAEWNEDMESLNFMHACKANVIPISATGLSGSIRIGGMSFAPGKYSIANYHDIGEPAQKFFYYRLDYVYTKNEYREPMNSHNIILNFDNPNLNTMRNYGLPNDAEKFADIEKKILHLERIIEIYEPDVATMDVYNLPAGWTPVYESFEGDAYQVTIGKIRNFTAGIDPAWTGRKNESIKRRASSKPYWVYHGKLAKTNEERIMAKRPMNEGYAAQSKKIKEKKASKYGEYSSAPITSHGFSKEDYCLQNDVDYDEIDKFEAEYGFFKPNHNDSWQKFTKLCADYGEELEAAFSDGSGSIAKQNAKARADAIAVTKNLLKSGERCRIKAGKRIVKKR